jgi:hypothetical protein
LHGDETVAETRGALVLELRCGIAHLALEPLHDLVGVAVEELAEFGDELAVGHLVDLTDTWTAAPAGAEVSESIWIKARPVSEISIRVPPLVSLSEMEMTARWPFWRFERLGKLASTWDAEMMTASFAKGWVRL